jgi:hypothetical protein
LAFALWIAASLSLILTNIQFIKMHRVLVVSYAAGWLVKLTIVAVAVVLFLR